LAALWQERNAAANAAGDDYPIGPGDILTVSVPEMPELANRKARVSLTGQIELPLLGNVQAGGLTEDGLAQELDNKLEKYMVKPQASVFVNEYRNREVAVVGAVNKPGPVVLHSPHETILDVLTQCGGLMPSAADELILIPATPIAANAAPDAVSAMAMANSSQALSIGLHSTSLTGGGDYLNMPMRPGDVIVVPGGGQVMVVGWVQRPGHFDVGSGLTVLGAVGEAGGPMYAADTGAVTLIRNGKDGTKLTQSINLKQIMQGQAPDIPVKANDVIDVPYSNWKIGPYVFYSVVSRVGIAGPVIPY
jgi:polysaccharide export outer membrane protein